MNEIQIRDSNKLKLAGPVEAFLVLTFGLMAYLLVMSPATACGPFLPEAIFSHTRRPDLPLTRYAAGELGVLQPTFARSYLAIAYLYLTNHKLTSEQQSQAARMWWHRLAELGTMDLNKASEEWLRARKRVHVPSPTTEFDFYRHISDKDYVSYINFQPQAFLSAASTLNAKLATQSANDTATKDWVAAQDKVFSVSSQPGYSCDSAAVPEPLPEDADPLLKAERAYQIACAHFYTQKFNQSLEEFKAIAKDKSSPFSKLASYLEARALVRAATLAPGLDAQTAMLSDNGAQTITGYDCLRKAKSIAECLLASKEMSEYHAASLGLLGYIGARLDPSERAKELAQKLLAGQDASLGQDLADYSILLDQLSPVPDQSISSPDQAAIPSSWNSDSPAVLSEQNDRFDLRFAAEVLAILATALLMLNEGRQEGSCRRWLFWLLLSFVLAPLSLTACSSSVHDQLNSTQAPLKTKAAAAVPDDELSRWVLNYQLRTSDAQGKAYREWKRSNSVAWLVSIVSKTNAADAHADEVLAAAAKVPADSPAYLTLAYHRIRLLADKKKRDEALQILKEVLALPARELPPSARNLLIGEGLELANTLAELKEFAFSSPSSLGIMEDENGLPANTSTAELKTLENGDRFAIHPQCLTEKSAEMINFAMPLSAIADLPSESSLPERLRLDITQAAWVRSVMLKQDALEKTLAKSLQDLHPQLSQSLTDYQKAAPGAEKDFIFASIVLRNPAMRPYVCSGAGRATEFSKLDDYRDNWWSKAGPGCSYSSTDGAQTKPAPPEPHFLTDDEKNRATAELASIKNAGIAPDYLCKLVLAWAELHPNDARLPEVLYRAVRATKFSGTDSNTTGFSKRAFQILHKNFPGNEWTKKTPYYY